jgi:hypothetical protein
VKVPFAPWLNTLYYLQEKQIPVTAAGILLVMHAGAVKIPTFSFSGLPLADNKVTAVDVLGHQFINFIATVAFVVILHK